MVITPGMPAALLIIKAQVDFDHTLGFPICAAQMVHAAERGSVWFARLQDAVQVFGCPYCTVETMRIAYGRRINPNQTSNKVLPIGPVLIKVAGT